MPLKVTDIKLLKRYIKIWRKISSVIEIEFANEVVFGNSDGEYKKTNIISYGDKINTNFYNEKEERKVPKKDTPYKCLSSIVLDSVVKTKKRLLSSNTFGQMQVQNK